MGVIRKLNHQAETVPPKKEGKEKEQEHIRGALKTCGYPNWTFVKTAKRFISDREGEMENHCPCVTGTSEKFRSSGGARTFSLG